MNEQELGPKMTGYIYASSGTIVACHRTGVDADKLCCAYMEDGRRRVQNPVPNLFHAKKHAFIHLVSAASSAHALSGRWFSWTDADIESENKITWALMVLQTQTHGAVQSAPLLLDLSSQALRFTSDHWTQIDALAQTLIERDCLNIDRDEAHEIMHQDQADSDGSLVWTGDGFIKRKPVDGSSVETETASEAAKSEAAE